MRVLIFGTVYCDTMQKLNLMEQWVQLHGALNQSCDLLLVDSASPLKIRGLNKVLWRRFDDNIGHLARGGQDGWGRAFCEGLQYAIDKEYDYVVHIEGDSLCSLRVMKICEQMRDEGSLALSVPVVGTRHVERGWAETGLMFFDVEFLEENNLIEIYDWHDGASKKYPHTPEAVVHDILADELEMMPWNNMRDDLNVLTLENIHEFDWITHTTPTIFDAFVESVRDAT